MIEAISILLLGLVLLLVGSELLVTTTERVANTFSISNFYASFFLIGIATSAPEIFISIESAIQNKTTLAVGNALGSNISNIALVFSISLLFVNLDKLDISLPTRPFSSMLILSGAAFVLMFFDQTLTSIDSLMLILIFIINIYFFQFKNEQESETKNKIGYVGLVLFLYLISSLALLLYGSNLFIKGATEIALFLGVSSYVIGLTLAALGTSLPELTASIQSARRGKVDFIIGNIIGSNIFNIAIAMTAAGIINSAFLVNTNILRDFSLLAFTSIVFYLIIRSNNFLKTVYSIVLVITYLLYIGFIFK